MADLIAVVFPTEEKAEEVRQKLIGMQKDYLIDIGDAAIATKTDVRQGQAEPAAEHHRRGRRRRQLLGPAGRASCS